MHLGLRFGFVLLIVLLAAIFMTPSTVAPSRRASLTPSVDQHVSKPLHRCIRLSRDAGLTGVSSAAVEVGGPVRSGPASGGWSHRSTGNSAEGGDGYV